MPKPLEQCMFCGAVPCECNKPAPKVRAARKRPAKVEAEVEPSTPAPPPVVEEEVFVSSKPDVRAAMKAKAKPTVRSDKSTTSVPPPERITGHAADDAEFQQAVRALGPLLHKSELSRYASVLAKPTTLDERKLAWKARVGR